MYSTRKLIRKRFKNAFEVEKSNNTLSHSENYLNKVLWNDLKT